MGSADRPTRRLLSCLFPVKVDQTARLLVGQQRAPVRSCPVRRKKAERFPADLLLGFNRAVKSKASGTSKPGCGSLFGGKVQQSRTQAIKSSREECLLSHWSHTEFHFRTFAAKDSPVLNLELTALQPKHQGPFNTSTNTNVHVQLHSSENK